MVTEQFIQEMSQIVGTDVSPDFRASVPEGTELGRTNLDGPGAQAVWRKQGSLLRAGQTPLPDRVPLYDVRRHDISNVPPTIAAARMSRYPGRFTMQKPKDWDAGNPPVIDETCAVCMRDPERPEGAEKPKFTSWDQLQEHYEFFHEMTFRRMERDRVERERREERGEMRTLLGAIVGLLAPGAKLPPEVQDQIDRMRENAAVVEDPDGAPGQEPRRGRARRAQGGE